MATTIPAASPSLLRVQGQSLEFSNDGQSDLLTSAPAPAIFYSELHREFRMAIRERRPLTILSIRGDIQSVAELVSMARTIERNLRAGDFYSRISESGYWICVRGNEGDAENLSTRLLADAPTSQRNGEWRMDLIELHLQNESEGGLAQPPSLESEIRRVDVLHFGDISKSPQ